ncbi:MAG: hypothetical protein Q8K96_00135 [Rubrivivax sp.]|nr:hypothetical protein [Rubrivivax sp.]
MLQHLVDRLLAGARIGGAAGPVGRLAQALAGQFLGRAGNQAVEQRGLGEFLARIGVTTQPGLALAPAGVDEGLLRAAQRLRAAEARRAQRAHQRAGEVRSRDLARVGGRRARQGGDGRQFLQRAQGVAEQRHHARRQLLLGQPGGRQRGQRRVSIRRVDHQHAWAARRARQRVHGLGDRYAGAADLRGQRGRRRLGGQPRVARQEQVLAVELCARACQVDEAQAVRTQPFTELFQAGAQVRGVDVLAQHHDEATGSQRGGHRLDVARGRGQHPAGAHGGDAHHQRQALAIEAQRRRGGTHRARHRQGQLAQVGRAQRRERRRGTAHRPGRLAGLGLCRRADQGRREQRQQGKEVAQAGHAGSPEGRTGECSQPNPSWATAVRRAKFTRASFAPARPRAARWRRRRWRRHGPTSRCEWCRRTA